MLKIQDGVVIVEKLNWEPQGIFYGLFEGTVTPHNWYLTTGTSITLYLQTIHACFAVLRNSWIHITKYQLLDLPNILDDKGFVEGDKSLVADNKSVVAADKELVEDDERHVEGDELVEEEGIVGDDKGVVEGDKGLVEDKKGLLEYDGLVNKGVVENDNGLVEDEKLSAKIGVICFTTEQKNKTFTLDSIFC